MQIKNNISLKPYNTFGLDAKTSHFAEVNNLHDLQELLQQEIAHQKNILVLGGGSNILFTKNFDGLIIKNNLKGIEKVKEDEKFIWVKSAAGEVWNDLVKWCIERGYGGIENLSLIPGSVGAAPIQNIGAYGVELVNVFYELEAIIISTGESKTFSKNDCRFEYRNSIFKNELKGKIIITSVTLQLNRIHTFNTTYGAIEQQLKATGVETITIKAVSDAVCAIRRSKLPDTSVLGNCGSFFKNPEVEKEKFEALKKEYEKITGFGLPNGKVKLAAGWLIEQCGWKGKVVGHTGAHKDQSLVLVNYGGATGEEIFNLSKQIQKSVFEKFGVVLEAEVNII